MGVFGGTFDPVHVGHVVAAVEARRVLRLDRVLMVPAGDPWQKRGVVVAPAADRLAMVRAAVEGIPGLEVATLEVDRVGPSYTYQTLEALSAPGRELFLIVGADVAATLSSWVGVEHLEGLATLVVVDRAEPARGFGGVPRGASGFGGVPRGASGFGGVPRGASGFGGVPRGASGDEVVPPGWRCERVAIPRLEVSSTGLRARAARGWPLDGLVPPGAVQVIADRRLYRP